MPHTSLRHGSSSNSRRTSNSKRSLTCAAWLRTLLSSLRSSFSSSCGLDGRQQRTRHDDASSPHGCHAANRSGAATCGSHAALRMPQLPQAAAATNAPQPPVPNPWRRAMPAAFEATPMWLPAAAPAGACHIPAASPMVIPAGQPQPTNLLEVEHLRQGCTGGGMIRRGECKAQGALEGGGPAARAPTSGPAPSPAVRAPPRRPHGRRSLRAGQGMGASGGVPAACRSGRGANPPGKGPGRTLHARHGHAASAERRLGPREQAGSQAGGGAQHFVSAGQRGWQGRSRWRCDRWCGATIAGGGLGSTVPSWTSAMPHAGRERGRPCGAIVAWQHPASTAGLAQAPSAALLLARSARPRDRPPGLRPQQAC